MEGGRDVKPSMLALNDSSQGSHDADRAPRARLESRADAPRAPGGSGGRPPPWGATGGRGRSSGDLAKASGGVPLWAAKGVW
jgi:hypothetical protein